MANAQKKFQKRKDREREVRKKILHRREQFRSQTKEQEKVDREATANDTKRKPICSALERRQKEAREAEIRRQLQHNIEILKALESQYDKDGGRPVEPNTITLCDPQLATKSVFEEVKEDIDRQILKDINANAENRLN